MKKYKHIIVMTLLIASAALAGIGMFFYAIENVWLFLLFIFCLVCALAVEKEV